MIRFHFRRSGKVTRPGRQDGVTFVVDLSITIDISFPDHLIYLLICQFLTKVCHHMTKFSSAEIEIKALLIVVFFQYSFDKGYSFPRYFCLLHVFVRFNIITYITLWSTGMHFVEQHDYKYRW